MCDLLRIIKGEKKKKKKKGINLKFQCVSTYQIYSEVTHTVGDTGQRILKLLP